MHQAICTKHLLAKPSEFLLGLPQLHSHAQLRWSHGKARLLARPSEFSLEPRVREMPGCLCTVVVVSIVTNLEFINP